MAIQITIRDVPEKVRDELASRAAHAGEVHAGVSASRIETFGRSAVGGCLAGASAQAKAGIADPCLFQADTECARRRPAVSAVVDASVLVAALVDSGPRGDWAERILAAGSLHAPEPAVAPHRDELRRMVRRSSRGARFAAGHAGSTVVQSQRADLQLPDSLSFESRQLMRKGRWYLPRKFPGRMHGTITET